MSTPAQKAELKRLQAYAALGTPGGEPPPVEKLCPGGVTPTFAGPKTNWRESLPGFWLPSSWPHYYERWPDYTTDLFGARLEQLDDFGDLFRLRGIGDPAKSAWGAWLGAWGCDKRLKRGWPDLELIADRMYDTARYKFLVPAWRRAIVSVVTELDDVEDQLSTILWVAEWVTKKIIPLPPRIMNKADQLRRSLDCGEKVLAGISPFKVNKIDYAECMRRQARALASAKMRRAGLLGWFRDNWGRLLEAAQATGTWVDVGLILGPVFGWIEEGMYGFARATVNNYLIAADALDPGFREDWYRNASELSAKVDQAWDDTWENLREWDQESIEEQMPGFFAP